MRDPNAMFDIALFCYPLAFNAPTEGFPWDDIGKILHGGQRMANVHKSSSADEIPERDVTYHLLCLLIYH